MTFLAAYFVLFVILPAALMLVWLLRDWVRGYEIHIIGRKDPEPFRWPFQKRLQDDLDNWIAQEQFIDYMYEGMGLRRPFDGPHELPAVERIRLTDEQQNKLRKMLGGS